MFMMSLMVPVSIYTVYLCLYSVVYVIPDLYLLTVNCVNHVLAIAVVLATYQMVIHNTTEYSQLA